MAAAELTPPTPEALILALADAYDYDTESVGSTLRDIALCSTNAAYADLLGHTPGWSVQQRDRLVRDLLDRIAPEYTARISPKGAAS